MRPITELTDQIMKPEKMDKDEFKESIAKFVEKVHRNRNNNIKKQKKSAVRCFKCFSRSNNRVDEVDELRFQFTRFFS